MNRPASRPVQTRSLRTRHAIENAAIGLFADMPVDAVAIDEIVTAAGVAKGTFYTHFADKRALVEALNFSIREEVEPLVAYANRGITDPARRLVRGIGVYVRFALDRRDRALLLSRIDDSQLAGSAELNQGLVTDLKNGLINGRLRYKAVDAATVFVGGVARVVILSISRCSSGLPDVEIAKEMAAMVLCGLGVAHDEAHVIADRDIDDIVATIRFDNAPTYPGI